MLAGPSRAATAAAAATARRPLPIAAAGAAAAPFCSHCRTRPRSRRFATPAQTWRDDAAAAGAATAAAALVRLTSNATGLRRASSKSAAAHDNDDDGSVPSLDIDRHVAVRLATLRMRLRDRLLHDQAASAAASSSASTSASDGGAGAYASSADVVGKQLKELEPVRQAWEAFTAKRSQLLSTLAMSRTDPDDDMRAMALDELPSLEAELDALVDELQHSLLLPSSSGDDIEASADGAILEVRPGVGGAEASLFTAEVTRMYTKFCENKPPHDDDEDDGRGEWSVEVLSTTSVDVSTNSGSSGEGLKEAILKVSGRGAYRRLKYEAGVHRVQRIPATQNLGKLQTSTIAVMVLPVSSSGGNGSEESMKADDVVDPKDVKTEVMRSRGAGGQHVNKTESAIRLTHEPTGITVSMQDSRSQHQNRTKAWAILRARLLDRKMREEVEDNRARRLAQVSGMERSDRVRTYNFPQDRVTDHRINLSLSGIDSIMDGEHEKGRGLAYLLSELEAESRRRKLEVLVELAESDEAVARGEVEGGGGGGGAGGGGKGGKGKRK